MSIIKKFNLQVDEKRNALLVTLDSLYDTRIACITEALGAEYSERLMKSYWSQRVYNAPYGISDEDFDALYKLRSVETLKYARPTLISNMIQDWATYVKTVRSHSPFPGYTEVFINFWPYKVSKEYAKEIADALGKMCEMVDRFTIINVDPLEITCLDVKLLFSGIVDFDYHVWLDNVARDTQLTTTPIPDVTIYAPRVFKGKLDERAIAENGEADVFAYFADRLSTLVSFEFIDISNWCDPYSLDSV